MRRRPALRKLALLDQAQGRDQLRTDAVVHVAHDAAAFFDNRLLAFHHLHALVVTCQLGMLFGDTLFQFRVKFFGVVERSYETVDKHPSYHDEHWQ